MPKNAIMTSENFHFVKNNDHTHVILGRTIPVQLTSVSCWLCVVRIGTWDADANNTYDGL